MSGGIEPPAAQGCYLLCFAHNPVAHAKHYLGYADDMAARIELHRKGKADARLTDALHRRGGTFVVARIWEGATEADEARLKCRSARKASPAMRKAEHKRGRSTGHYCPICNGPDAAARRGLLDKPNQVSENHSYRKLKEARPRNVMDFGARATGLADLLTDDAGLVPA